MTKKPSESIELHASFKLDRRAFLGGVSLAAGGVLVSTLIPVQVEAATCAASSAVTDPCGDWTIDDMWGAYPPYSHPIPYGRPQVAPMDVTTLEGVDPIDYNFLA